MPQTRCEGVRWVMIWTEVEYVCFVERLVGGVEGVREWMGKRADGWMEEGRWGECVCEKGKRGG